MSTLLATEQLNEASRPPHDRGAGANSLAIILAFGRPPVRGAGDKHVGKRSRPRSRWRLRRMVLRRLSA